MPLLTLCMVLCLIPTAWAGNPTGKLRTLVNEFGNEPGFEVVDMGPVALGLIRAAARGEVKNDDDRKALQVFKDIKRLTILDFSDADKSVAFGSDAPHLKNFTHKAICGPGSITVAHRDDEHVLAADLATAVEQYLALYRSVTE